MRKLVFFLFFFSLNIYPILNQLSMKPGEEQTVTIRLSAIRYPEKVKIERKDFAIVGSYVHDLGNKISFEKILEKRTVQYEVGDEKMKAPRRAILWLSIASLIQGSTFPIQKMVLGNVSPFVYNSLRFGVATLASLLLFGPGRFKRGFVLGTVLGVAYVFQTWGLQLTTASKSGFVVSSFALMVPVVAYLVEGEKPTPLKLASLALGGAGLYLLTGGVRGVSLGDVFQMFCAILFAFHVVLITKFSRVEEEKDMMFWQFFTVTAMNALFGIGKKWHLPEESLIVGCYTGVLATAFGIFLQLKYQKWVGNNATALVFMVQPVFSLSLSAIFLSEKMSSAQLFGGIILLLAFLTGTLVKSRGVY